MHTLISKRTENLNENSLQELARKLRKFPRRHAQSSPIQEDEKEKDKILKHR